MKAEDKYLKFVLWSDEDKVYVGFCPDLFPWGGICHSPTEEDAYKELCEIVHSEVEELLTSGKTLPEPSTRPMREALAER